MKEKDLDKCKINYFNKVSKNIFTFYKVGQNSFLLFCRQKSKQKTVSFCQKEKKTTPFRIWYSTCKNISHYLESLSLRVKRSNPNIIASLFLDCFGSKAPRSLRDAYGDDKFVARLGDDKFNFQILISKSK